VGIATPDIVKRVARHPGEDEEVRALSRTVRRGGNATNTLVVPSRLRHARRLAAATCGRDGPAGLPVAECGDG